MLQLRAFSLSMVLAVLACSESSGTASPGEAVPLEVDGPARSGKLRSASDVDVFSFSLDARVKYLLACEGACELTATTSSPAVLSSSALRAGAVRLWSPGPGPVQVLVELRMPGGRTPPFAYTVRLQRLGADDHSDTPTGAQPLAPGSAVDGTSESLDDSDVFIVEGQAGHLYGMDCSAAGSLVPSVLLGVTRVEDALALPLVSARAGQREAPLLLFKSLASARYAVAVRVVQAYETPGGTFHCELVDLGPVDDPHGDTPAGASELSAGAGGEASLHPGLDVDTFRFSVPAGRTFRFTCTRSDAARCVLRLLDERGAVLEARRGASVAFEGTTAGATTVLVQVEGRGEQQRYTYALEDLGPDDHANAAEGATALVGSPLRGEGLLPTGTDVDVFSATLQAGHWYRLICASVELRCESLVVLAEGSGSYDPTAFTDFKVRQAGVVTLHVRAQQDESLRADSSGAAPRGVGAYAVTLVDLGADDHGDTAAEASPRPTGSSELAAHFTFGGDVDVFRLSLAHGRAYRLKCLTASSTCNLMVMDAQGQFIESWSRRPGEAGVWPRTGPLEVTVQLRPAEAVPPGGPLPYTFRIEDLGPDDHGDGFASATTVSTASELPAVLGPGDVDVFEISGPSGHWYEVRCVSDQFACEQDLPWSESEELPWSPPASVFVKRGASDAPHHVRVFGSFGFGPYTLEVLDRGFDDVGEYVEGAPRLAVGELRHGVLQVVQDLDTFVVQVEGGVRYRLFLDAVGPWVRGWSVGEGANLFETTPPPEGWSFVAPRSGDFALQVGGGAGVGYALRVVAD